MLCNITREMLWPVPNHLHCTFKKLETCSPSVQYLIVNVDSLWCKELVMTAKQTLGQNWQAGRFFLVTTVFLNYWKLLI